jgi:hypothetical protein
MFGLESAFVLAIECAMLLLGWACPDGGPGLQCGPVLIRVGRPTCVWAVFGVGQVYGVTLT